MFGFFPFWEVGWVWGGLFKVHDQASGLEDPNAALRHTILAGAEDDDLLAVSNRTSLRHHR